MRFHAVGGFIRYLTALNLTLGLDAMFLSAQNVGCAAIKLVVCWSAWKWLLGMKYGTEAELTQCTRVYRHKYLDGGVLRKKQSCH